MFIIEYSIGNGQLSDVTGSAHVMGKNLEMQLFQINQSKKVVQSL